MNCNPILNGMVNIVTIPVTCMNCDCAFTASQGITDREIVICPQCGFVMMAVIQKYGEEKWQETLDFYPVQGDGNVSPLWRPRGATHE